MIFPSTPSQTVGPFFAIGLPWPEGPLAADEGTPGAIRIFGTVYDGAGSLVPDFLIETWQADPDGRFADLHGHGGPSRLAGFRGFARYGQELADLRAPDGNEVRSGREADASFEIRTAKPGPVPGPGPGPGDTVQAPHIDVSVFARGMLHRGVTRIYFADETTANAADPVLAHVPEQRRATLLALPVETGYRFDIHLQGSEETVFFAV